MVRSPDVLQNQINFSVNFEIMIIYCPQLKKIISVKGETDMPHSRLTTADFLIYWKKNSLVRVRNNIWQNITPFIFRMHEVNDIQ